MSGVPLSEIIQLAPGFKAAVNLNYDRDNIEKAGSYLPTQVGSQVLFDVARNLQSPATRRARLLMGTYGTGKSHLALVLTFLYSRRWDDERLAPLFARLADRWPGETQHLKQELRRVHKPFLIVRLEGDEGNFNEALLRALRRSLTEDESTRGLMPDTAFEAAARRIEELRSSYPEAYAILDKALEESGFVSAEVAKERLRDYSLETYQAFLEAHKQACAGAEFHPDQMTKPSEAYASLSRQLHANGSFAGIVVFWDEFGRYMERMADDPQSDESVDIQSFAEVCSVPENNLHLYLICHRSLEEYAHISHLRRGRGDEQRLVEDMRKVTGRFTPFIMRSADDEVYGLVDQVIIQNRLHPAWQRLISERSEEFESMTQFAADLRLFPDFTKEQVHNVVTVGCFPLHPVAAFCLPRLSEVVAQNERTLFTYLSDSGEGSLGHLIGSASMPEAYAPLPLATLADLWDYFEEQIRSDEEARKIHRLFESAVARVSSDDTYAVRILKAVGVLAVLGQRAGNLKATAENLAYALDVPEQDRAKFEGALQALTSSGQRILVRSPLDSSYRFATASTESLDERLDATLRDPSVRLEPIQHLNAILAKSDLRQEIPATGYADERHVPRRLKVEIMSPEQLRSLDRWNTNLGRGSFADGYALLCVPEGSQELKDALELAREVQHPQMAVAVPRRPLPNLFWSARRHEALQHIQRSNPSIYGPHGELYEEWETAEREYRALVERELRELLEGREGRIESVCWFWKGDEQPDVRTVSQVTGLASRIMFEVFPYTPPIPHDVLSNEGRKDNIRKFRVPVIERILEPDGPKVLAGEKEAAQKHVVNALLRGNGILRMDESGDYVLGRPHPEEHPAMAAVWDEIERFVQRARDGRAAEMSELVEILRRPPYGLPVRCMPVIFAAVVREMVMRGNLEFDRVHDRSGVRRKLSGESIESAFAFPDSYRLVYIDLSRYQHAFLSGLASAVGIELPQTDSVVEMIDAVQKGVERWWNELPRHAQLTREISADAQTVRDEVLCPLAMPGANAREILLEKLPELIHPEQEEGPITANEVEAFFLSVKEELEGAVDRLRAKLGTVVLDVMGCEGNAPQSPEDALADWFASLPEEKRGYQFPGDAGKLAAACRNPQEVERLAEALVGMAISGWADEVVEQFRGRLESAKGTAETYEVPGAGGERIPPRNHVRITITLEDGTQLPRVIPVVRELSDNGRIMERIVRGAVEGMGRSLPDGECLSILVAVLRDALETY